MRAGRPLRFLAIAISGWTAGRTVMLWPIAEGAAAIARVIRPPATAMLARVPPVVPPADAAAPPRPHRSAHGPVAGPVEPPAVADRMIDASFAPVPVPSPIGRTIVAPFLPVASGPSPRRFAASAWMIARQGLGGSSTSGQLGGSQLGVRGTFMIDRAARIALSARLSAPLTGVGREAAIGVDWQPLDAPLHLVAERRVALDNGRSGTALLAIAGIGPRRFAPGVAIEAYGQAGTILRDGIAPFADGAARLSFDLGRTGGVQVDAGAGAWGGAQHGAARLDLGPSIGVRLPTGQRAVRVTLDCGIM